MLGKGRSKAIILEGITKFAGQALANRLAQAETQDAIRAVWAKARRKLPTMAQIALDALIAALVESPGDADANPPETDGVVIDMVEGRDFTVRPDPKP